MRRLAFDTGHQLSTVQQAVSRLTDPNDPNRFFDNVNPGRGKTPFYKIRWDAVRAVVDEFEARTRLPTVPQLPNGLGKAAVLESPNSHCSATDRPTVRDLQNKTNFRTKGAGPAASQAAGPARAPFERTAEKNVATTGPPVSNRQPPSKAAEVDQHQKLPLAASQVPSEAEKARVQALFQKHEEWLRNQEPLDPSWPRGKHSGPAKLNRQGDGDGDA